MSFPNIVFYPQWKIFILSILKLNEFCFRLIVLKHNFFNVFINFFSFDENDSIDILGFQ